MYAFGSDAKYDNAGPMITVERFKGEHLLRLDEQGATAYLRPYFRDESIKALEHSAFAYTAFSKETNRVLGCGGVYEFWKDRGEAWAILSKNCRKEFIAIHNATKRFFDLCSIRRIEVTVDCNFNNAHRWARSLGFQMEAERMRAYHPNGTDCALYARVRN